ncbi:MAG: hypothetical protein IKU13_05375, partial [Clostridia bacterium]|nr:hypothetical protein [Clostridia bacterium]
FDLDAEKDVEKTITVYQLDKTASKLIVEIAQEDWVFPGGRGGFRLIDGVYRRPDEEFGNEGQWFGVSGAGVHERGLGFNHINENCYANMAENDITHLSLDYGVSIYFTYADLSSYEVKPVQQIAYASTQPVNIDGKAVELQAYALKDKNGNMTNYVKLRDVANVLNGSKAQFQVGWDGNVNILTGQSYTANGSEMKTPFSGDRKYTVPTTATNVNGVKSELSAITLTDDNGNGYTYYKLRDLDKELGFNVGWSGQLGIFIQTDRAYTDAD